MSTSRLEAGKTQLVGNLCTLSLNPTLECPPEVPLRVPAAFAVPSHYCKGQREPGILLGSALHCFLQGLAGFGGSSRAGCSCEHEATSPGSAPQLQATAVSEKCSCLYSCSLFPLPFVCRHVTADASHQYNGYLDSFGAGTSNCNPANKKLSLSELSRRFVNSH